MTKTPGRLSSRIALVAFPLVVALNGRLASAQCIGDLTGDGWVDGADLATLLNAWGRCPNGNPGCTGDLDSDGSTSGIVDGGDLSILLAAWGSCPGQTVPTWATLVDAYPNPAVVSDPALRAAIVATGLAWRVRDTATQIEMLLVPPGTFQMGCMLGSDQYGCVSDELPVHTVTLTHPFYLGRYEVTQAQWEAQVGSNPSQFSWAADSSIRPVDTVTWNMIQGFCASTGMRLPTEAEWEYACRAGTTAPFYNGGTDDQSLDSLAWFGAAFGGNGIGGTRAVGGKAANSLGFYDMLGNVFEWVYDRFGDYPATAQTDPTGPTTPSARTLRGGSWEVSPLLVRSSARVPFSPGNSDYYIGFRAARGP